MKVIIAGSRGITDAAAVSTAMADSGYAHTATEIVSGRCPAGVDALGEFWALERGLPVTPFPAKWSGQGKQAGLIRNVKMAQYANALVAVWDGGSPGTAHMIQCMKAAKKPVYVYITR